MQRAVVGILKLARGATVAFAVLATGGLIPVQARQASSSCTLLQVADIEAALGGKASGKPAAHAEAAPGMAIDECTVPVTVAGHKDVHRVMVRSVKDLPIDAGDALRSMYGGLAREQQWKTNGARFEQKTIGSATCAAYGRPGVLGHSQCSIPKGKAYLEVDVTAGSAAELIPIDKVAVLAQKAATR